jgi:threonine-phosphate decarboxylase
MNSQFTVRHLEPWSVNGPAQKVAACLADRNFGLKTERWLHQERNFLTRALIAIKGLEPYRSSTNFLLVRIARGNGVLELRSFLLRKKILIRACHSFAGPGSDHFRVAVRRRNDNRLLLAALREWAAESLR